MIDETFPSHDHKTFAILTRKDLWPDLGHLAPSEIPPILRALALADLLAYDKPEGHQENSWKDGFPPLVAAIERKLRFSRSTYALRSNQMTTALSGSHEDGGPDKHLAPEYGRDKGVWSQ